MYDCYYENQVTQVNFVVMLLETIQVKLDYINAGFTNRDEETARGIDINYRASRSFEIGDRLLMPVWILLLIRCLKEH